MLLWRVKWYEVVVDISGDVPLEASNDLSLGAALQSPTSCVLPGSWIMAQARDGDQVEGAVGLAVTTAVEPMSVRLAGGGRDGSRTAEVGEGRFRP
jgi:hypothetical protein